MVAKLKAWKWHKRKFILPLANAWPALTTKKKNHNHKEASCTCQWKLRIYILWISNIIIILISVRLYYWCCCCYYCSVMHEVINLFTLWFSNPRCDSTYHRSKGKAIALRYISSIHEPCIFHALALQKYPFYLMQSIQLAADSVVIFPTSNNIYRILFFCSEWKSSIYKLGMVVQHWKNIDFLSTKYFHDFFSL